MSEFEASLVYRMSVRTARATQKNRISNNNKNVKIGHLVCEGAACLSCLCSEFVVTSSQELILCQFDQWNTLYVISDAILKSGQLLFTWDRWFTSDPFTGKECFVFVFFPDFFYEALFNIHSSFSENFKPEFFSFMMTDRGIGISVFIHIKKNCK